MEFIESETVELKQQYVSELRKTIVAFANSVGGSLYIGVTANGEAIGVENPDLVLQQIMNSVRDGIRPDILMFIKGQIMNIKNKNIVAIDVQPGTRKPYYITEKGMKPTGVFIRRGSSSLPASEQAIRQMIKEADGENFEDMRSLNQELTFREAEYTFSRMGVEFGASQRQTLGVVDSDGIYTNLGLLLSDQCPHLIKIALFKTNDVLDFQNRAEFGGSVFKQLDDAYQYLDWTNRKKVTISGLYRIDNRDYPEVALREALVNSIIHRDYSYLVPTKISLFANRVEFISYGGIAKGARMESLINGLSICRNPKLANVFYRLTMIEAYGTGLPRIIKSYATENVRPEFFANSDMFKVTLPSIVYSREHYAEIAPAKDMVKESVFAPYQVKGSFSYANITSPEEKAVVEALQNSEYGWISRPQVQELLGVSLSTANRLLKAMQSRGVIDCEGKGRSTRYTLKK